MLETFAIVLVLLWFLGIVTAYTFGGFLHLLLAFAFGAIVIRVFRNNKPVT